jgi:hypothetical protein
MVAKPRPRDAAQLTATLDKIVAPAGRLTTIPAKRKELHQVNSSSSALASFKSSVPKPSVNHP